MSIRFVGGEKLQKGRGIGGLLSSFVRSLFFPIVKSAGKGIAKVASSTTAKSIGNAVKDQILESGVKVGTDLLRGKNVKDSLKDEFHQVKRKAADLVEEHANKVIKKRPKVSRQQRKAKKVYTIKRKGDLFG